MNQMSIIWILGEFGSKIEAAPYLLEDIVHEAFDVEEELSLSQKKEHSSQFRLNVCSLKLQAGYNFLAPNFCDQAVHSQTSRNAPWYVHHVQKYPRKQ